MRDSFAVTFTASESEARDSVRAVARRLRRAGIAPDRAGEVELAIAEAVNNVVEHAYAGRAPGPVGLCCNLHGRRLAVRICDLGLPLPDGRLPQAPAADLSGPRGDLPEGGFGWFLIRAFASHIRYDRCRGCNSLALRFDL
ncbi:MAG: ATP-binding protein [Jhaorihella sp.]